MQPAIHPVPVADTGIGPLPLSPSPRKFSGVSGDTAPLPQAATTARLRGWDWTDVVRQQERIRGLQRKLDVVGTLFDAEKVTDSVCWMASKK